MKIQGTSIIYFKVHDYIFFIVGFIITIIGVKKESLIFVAMGVLITVIYPIIIGIIRRNKKKSKEKLESILESISDQIKPKKYCCGLYSNNDYYRLGDMVIWQERWLSGGQEYHYKNFPNSIATEYMKKTDKQKNYNILFSIVQQRTKETKDLPDKNDIVIHLRVGDVVENNPADVITILSTYTYMDLYSQSNYTPPLSYIEDKIKKINQKDVGKLIFVAGSHIEIPTPKSCQYIEIIKRYFEIKGYNIQTRLGKKADEDFIFMCNAKYFIPSTNGGYTGLIKKMVERMGNTVL
jgi:hypothetical protein